MRLSDRCCLVWLFHFSPKRFGVCMCGVGRFEILSGIGCLVWLFHFISRAFWGLYVLGKNSGTERRELFGLVVSL